ncbi:Uncharacterised protein [Clostridium putrefaciens]|uniref:Uncharacterized protein n=1 Tax=Clostridium putrefaciens TaxID=99675 RepID=A0A381JAP5_9CLOT|nr:hypothetical protein [Clostridium putrefaciens]SUY48069.1 Uncharacterised protein [Clostridium putrefaciens]
MKRSVKIVMLINLINYVSNFAFSYAYSNKLINSSMIALGIWALTPYLLATISSFILATDYREELKVFKKEAIADWIVRVISCVLVFQEFKFGFMSKEYIVQQAILVLLLLINIYLEFRMYNKAKAYIYVKKEAKKNEVISEDEKQNIKNMGKAVFLGLISLIIVSAISMSVPSTTHMGAGKVSNIFAIIISTSTFLWFLHSSCEKCRLFYLDKSLAKRIFLRDGFYATIGFVICLLATFEVLGAYHLIYNVSTFIGILFLYPTIRTNRKMAMHHKRVVGILGDNFELYYNCKD